MLFGIRLTTADLCHVDARVFTPAVCVAHMNAHHWNAVWQHTRKCVCGSWKRLCACVNAAGWKRADDGQSSSWLSEVSPAD